MKRNKIVIVFLTLAALSLVGCSKNETPPEPPAEAIAPVATPPVIQQPLSSAMSVAPPSSRVDFSAMKDPFKPYAALIAGSVTPKMNRFGQIIPILNYDLIQFSVKGIIVGMKENSALIIDPTGKPYVVKVGMEIGRNDGKITKITSTYIEVFEQYRDEAGKVKKNITKLMLPKKE